MRTLQCVAFSGLDSSTVLSSVATRSSSCVRGLPERGASYNPANPCSRYRVRQWLTSGLLTPKRSAIAVFDSPSAERRMISARRTSPCGSERDATSAANCFRSSLLRTSSKRRGRPARLAVRIDAPRKYPRNPCKNNAENYWDTRLASLDRRAEIPSTIGLPSSDLSHVNSQRSNHHSTHEIPSA